MTVHKPFSIRQQLSGETEDGDDFDKVASSCRIFNLHIDAEIFTVLFLTISKPNTAKLTCVLIAVKQ